VIHRSRLIAPLIAVAAALLLAQYARVWVATPDLLARTSDFAGTYAAATLWREGQAAHMYDSAAEQRVLAATRAPSNHLDIPFENPPAAALVGAPFSLLDAVAAYRAWSLLQLGFVVLAVVVAARAAPWPERTPRVVRLAIALVAIAGFGTGALWIEGQWDGPLVLGLSLAYWAWRRDRSSLAGVAIGVTAAIAKPHLMLGVAAFMVGRRDWRALGAAAGGALATMAVSLLTQGPGALTAFAAALMIPRYSPSLQMQSAFGLFASWLGDTILANRMALAAAAISFCAAALIGARTRGRRAYLEPALGAAAVLSLFGSPHLLSHDLSLLAPVLVFVCAWVALTEARAGRSWPGPKSLAALGLWVAVSLASQHDLGAASLADVRLGQFGRITPWALLLSAAACAALMLRTPATAARASPAALHSADGAA
jgi:Glycosyltransferase family 87